MGCIGTFIKKWKLKTIALTEPIPKRTIYKTTLQRISPQICDESFVRHVHLKLPNCSEFKIFLEAGKKRIHLRMLYIYDEICIDQLYLRSDANPTKQIHAATMSS